jgi:hypothetical protein
MEGAFLADKESITALQLDVLDDILYTIYLYIYTVYIRMCVYIYIYIDGLFG